MCTDNDDLVIIMSIYIAMYMHTLQYVNFYIVGIFQELYRPGIFQS